jgi:GMP synthase (glutamine-hydrolysing)
MEKNKVVNVIRHLAFEDLASFASVLQAHNYQINYIEAAYDELSQIDAFSQRLAADKPTLGICLGAQLIASALGAKVYPGKEKEIGWYPLRLTEAGKHSALRYLSAEHCSMLHWHGETFDLPGNAVLLASSEKYPNQAFSYGSNILALQFHPEITQRAMEKWFIGHIGEIMQTEGVSVEQLRDDTHQFANRLEVQGELFFNSWFNEVT